MSSAVFQHDGTSVFCLNKSLKYLHKQFPGVSRSRSFSLVYRYLKDKAYTKEKDLDLETPGNCLCRFQQSPNHRSSEEQYSTGGVKNSSKNVE